MFEIESLDFWIVCYFEELSSDDNDWGSTVSDFCVLQLGELHDDFASRVLNFELLQNGCTFS